MAVHDKKYFLGLLLLSKDYLEKRVLNSSIGNHIAIHFIVYVSKYTYLDMFTSFS